MYLGTEDYAEYITVHSIQNSKGVGLQKDLRPK